MPRRRTTHLWLLLPLALAAGCDTPQTAGPGLQVASPASPGAAAVPAGGARLIFRQKLLPGGPNYTEGTVSFVRVEDNGRAVVDKEIEGNGPLTLALPP